MRPRRRTWTGEGSCCPTPECQKTRDYRVLRLSFVRAYPHLNLGNIRLSEPRANEDGTRCEPGACICRDLYQDSEQKTNARAIPLKRDKEELFAFVILRNEANKSSICSKEPKLKRHARFVDALAGRECCGKTDTKYNCEAGAMPVLDRVWCTKARKSTYAASQFG